MPRQHVREQLVLILQCNPYSQQPSWVACKLWLVCSAERSSPDVHAAEGVGVLGVLQQLLHLPFNSTRLSLACKRGGLGLRWGG